MNVEEVSSVVVDTVFHLHRDLRPGLLESVYEAVLARMLEERGLRVERQVSVAFDFNDMHFDERNFASSRLRVSQKVGGTASVRSCMWHPGARV
ncbi:MAG: GxxExxY protein [Euryarchaeota archaeon]|nr:GxxExxY protein [Euryarchaeota archaeon]